MQRLSGKLYKGDVADVVESGDTWTHVVSGDVDGYVNNDYCVSGEDALAYAQENVETEAQVNTNGLRVRNEASEDASVITAVSEGTTLTVDTDAEAEDGWVAVKYKRTDRICQCRLCYDRTCTWRGSYNRRRKGSISKES